MNSQIVVSVDITVTVLFTESCEMCLENPPVKNWEIRNALDKL